MFLLVSVHHVIAHLDEDQQGVSIQISKNLSKKILRITGLGKIAVTWIFSRIFAYVPSFFAQILDCIYWWF